MNDEGSVLAEGLRGHRSLARAVPDHGNRDTRDGIPNVLLVVRYVDGAVAAFGPDECPMAN